MCVPHFYHSVNEMVSAELEQAAQLGFTLVTITKYYVLCGMRINIEKAYSVLE